MKNALLGNSLEFLAQAGKQQGAECGVACNEGLDRVLVEDVGEHFFARHETVAAASGHERAPVKAVLRAVNVHGVAALHLCNLPLDDEIERRRGGPGFNDDLLRLKVGNIYRSAYQRLF